VIVAVDQSGGLTGWLAVAACAVAAVPAALRWLRVAQREHYLPDSVSRFALRWWWRSGPLNLFGLVAALAGLVLATRWPALAFVTAAVVSAGPIGLGLRGSTSPLRWTRRLRTLASVWIVVQGAIVAVAAFSSYGATISAAGALAVPAVVDVACLLTLPLEKRLADRYVRRAAQQLRLVNPKIVAITGSFGKTSTKGYVTHLLAGTFGVVASPASFNNRAGLARAVNEHLAQGTEVFVAEMGTYGRGEIAELCSWMKPDVAVITAIGPVHLERFGNEDEICKAKSEILVEAESCVLVVDDMRLAALADQVSAQGKRVWRVSSGREMQVDVMVVETEGRLDVRAQEAELAHGVPVSARAGNVACAVAVALELGVPVAEITKRLSSLPTAQHRLQPQQSDGGFVILDDTYNANPAGARAALSLLAVSGEEGRSRVVVSPGMVELGRRQYEENYRFAEEAAGTATDLVVVGRTNRKALVEGFRRASSSDGTAPVVVEHRQQAVAWVHDHLGPGDAVLYENDLPDHYP
jgi:UDP-N-acetylmuramoyl-tripeptide--D-alanyl-D-alanine ligase